MVTSEKVTQFLNKLRGLSWARPEEPGKEFFHVGGIVAGEADMPDAITAVTAASETATITIPSDSFADAVQAANEKGQSLLVILTEDMPFDVLQQVKLLAESNEVASYTDSSSIEHHPETRVIFVFTKETWAKQTNPAFIDLFGVLCRLDT